LTLFAVVAHRYRERHLRNSSPRLGEETRKSEQRRKKRRDSDKSKGAKMPQELREEVEVGDVVEGHKVAEVVVLLWEVGLLEEQAVHLQRHHLVLV
jgi:hypothetical protein